LSLCDAGISSSSLNLQRLTAPWPVCESSDMNTKIRADAVSTNEGDLLVLDSDGIIEAPNNSDPQLAARVTMAPMIDQRIAITPHQGLMPEPDARKLLTEVLPATQAGAQTRRTLTESVMFRGMRVVGRRIGVGGLLLMLWPAAAAAQSERSTSLFVFGGVGGVTPDDVFTFWKGPTWRVGAGLEHRFASQLLLQAELELLQRPKSPGEQTALLPSFDVGYEFGRRGIRPFISGGYTLAARDAIFNVGGGVNIRLMSGLALRVEFRDHRMIFDVPVDSYGVRVGLTLR